MAWPGPRTLTKIDVRRAPASYYLGVLGMPGLTAWFGLIEIGQPKAGETVVVSAASGAVGSVVGQLAKIKGCRVGRHRRRQGQVRLRRAGTRLRRLRRLQGRQPARRICETHCPKGVDVYFENVGGAILDTLLRIMNLRSRIIVCGLIADYNATEPYGYKMLRSVLVNRIRMQGMIVFDWKDRYGEALKGLGGYLAEGKLKYRESVVDGLANAPKGLIALLKGENFGKQLVKLA